MHGTGIYGIRRTECESLHVAIDAVAVYMQPLRIYGIYNRATRRYPIIVEKDSNTIVT